MYGNNGDSCVHKSTMTTRGRRWSGDVTQIDVARVTKGGVVIGINVGLQ